MKKDLEGSQSSPREIKFRAWHHRAKAMGKWEVLRALLFGDAVRWPIRLSNNRPYPETITFFEIGNANIFENPDLVVMQYTGLKDMSGTEIYEGDIVQSTSDGRVLQTAPVECLGPTEWQWGRYGTIHEALTYRWEDIRIIGNIYEHPEKLKGEPASGEPTDPPSHPQGRER